LILMLVLLQIVVTTPQWHDFDGGWWQVDD
jgi:hypothetical protein